VFLRRSAHRVAESHSLSLCLGWFPDLTRWRSGVRVPTSLPFLRRQSSLSSSLRFARYFTRHPRFTVCPAFSLGAMISTWRNQPKSKIRRRQIAPQTPTQTTPPLSILSRKPPKNPSPQAILPAGSAKRPIDRHPSQKSKASARSLDKIRSPRRTDRPQVEPSPTRMLFSLYAGPGHHFA
jgi:hypothetical protein